MDLCQRKSQSPLQWPGVEENDHSGQKHEEDFSREESNVMEHISRNHMQPSQLSGKSYFICNDKQYVFAKFVRETMNKPDKSFPHKRYKKRGVRQKTFKQQVGVHGLRKVPCYTVTVIYDCTNYKEECMDLPPRHWWNRCERQIQIFCKKHFTFSIKITSIYSFLHFHLHRPTTLSRNRLEKLKNMCLS